MLLYRAHETLNRSTSVTFEAVRTHYRLGFNTAVVIFRAGGVTKGLAAKKSFLTSPSVSLTLVFSLLTSLSVSSVNCILKTETMFRRGVVQS